MNINELVTTAHRNSVNKGFWDDMPGPGEPVIPYISMKLALIHSEVSEVLEELRDGHPMDATRYTAGGKPEGIPSELADIIIRVADLAGAFPSIDLEDMVIEKMGYNSSRPYKHGRTV